MRVWSYDNAFSLNVASQRTDYVPTIMPTWDTCRPHSSIVARCSSWLLPANAFSVVVAHNHLSGDIRPSDDDEATTGRLCRAGTLLDIPLTDHLIVSDAHHYSSFAQTGLRTRCQSRPWTGTLNERLQIS